MERIGVWVVSLGDGGQSSEIAGVFSTQEGAEAFVDSFKPHPVGHMQSDLSIEVFALDEPRDWVEGIRPSVTGKISPDISPTQQTLEATLGPVISGWLHREFGTG